MESKTIEISRCLEVSDGYQYGQFEITRTSLSREILHQLRVFNDEIDKHNQKVTSFFNNNDEESYDSHWVKTEDELKEKLKTETNDWKKDDYYFIPKKEKMIDVDNDWTLESDDFESIDRVQLDDLQIDFHDIRNGYYECEEELDVDGDVQDEGVQLVMMNLKINSTDETLLKMLESYRKDWFFEQPFGK